jgi:hypothetical protein
MALDEAVAAGAKLCAKVVVERKVDEATCCAAVALTSWSVWTHPMHWLNYWKKHYSYTVVLSALCPVSCDT